MQLSIKQMIGQRMMLAFQGKEHPSKETINAIKNYEPAGVTLFRNLNIGDLFQVRALTDSLQRLARDSGLPSFLIATDQEGGQLMAVGQGTALPGNMALGATGSADLVRQAGEVLGSELAALGINVNYAPCVDVNIDPRNPVVGIRSFGENPHEVARFAAAMIDGIQSQGVAATAKHFPGHGDTARDSHHELPMVSHSLERLNAVEFLPFKSAIQTGTKLIMTGHIGLSAIDGPNAPPATLSPSILKIILRHNLNFGGVIITDAMDMHAIKQGELLGDNAVRAALAGADLLLITSNPADQLLVHSSLMQAARDGRLSREEIISSSVRIQSLKSWLTEKYSAPDLNIIHCAAHQKIANEIAARSVTLVRDQRGLLPLQIGSAQNVAVVVTDPVDLTPADTSSYVIPSMASVLREYHPNVEEFLIPHSPSENEVAVLLQKLHDFHLIVLGTLNAYDQPAQAEFVRQVLGMNIPTVVVALRLPYDLAAFPEASTFVCTYSILEPSMHALVSALFGRSPFRGRLPVSIPGLYAAGYGESL